MIQEIFVKPKILVGFRFGEIHRIDGPAGVRRVMCRANSSLPTNDQCWTIGQCAIKTLRSMAQAELSTLPEPCHASRYELYHSGSGAHLRASFASTVHICSVVARQSRRQYLIQFIEQLREIVAEELMGFTQAAPLAEGRIIEIVRLDAETRGDVVADEL